MSSAPSDAVSYAEAGRRLGISRYRVRKLIDEQQLRTVMRLGRPMVAVTSIRDYESQR